MENFNFTGYNDRPARCGVTCASRNTRATWGTGDAGSCTVILTELSDNPGMSVTNAVELIASQYVSRTKVDPGRVTWIEHYPGRGHGRKESFDLVTMKWSWDGRQWTACSPEWSSVSRQFVEELLGDEDVPYSD